MVQRPDDELAATASAVVSLLDLGCSRAESKKCQEEHVVPVCSNRCPQRCYEWL
jgi:hypothetical protein